MEMRISNCRRLILTRTAAGTVQTSIFNYYLVCTRDGPTADEYKMTPPVFFKLDPAEQSAAARFRLNFNFDYSPHYRVPIPFSFSAATMRAYMYMQRYLVTCNINYTLTVFS